MKKPLTFEIYRSTDGFRWRLRASNGKILADSGEAYSRHGRLMTAINRIVSSRCKVVDKTKK